MIPRYLAAVCTFLVLTIAACSGTTNASRYRSAQDGAPLSVITPRDVSDAVPRADPVMAAGNKSPYKVNGVTYEVLEDYRNYRQRGNASWYGTKFNGHRTANGEIFDLYRASAAHRTLPIPCYARVTNLDNGRSVVVRVNDRGPFHSDRLIDLSYGAAVKLGFAVQGTARVDVEVLDIAGVDDRRRIASGTYRFLQLGAFGSQSSARQLQGELQQLLPAPVVVSTVQSGQELLYRVRVGPLASAEEIQAIQQRLQEGGYDRGQPLP